MVSRSTLARHARKAMGQAQPLAVPKLHTLAPRLRAINTSTIKPPPKLKDPVYNSPEFAAWRALVIARAHGRCEAIDEHGQRCPKAKPKHRVYADHIRELRDGGALLDPNNGQCLCASHHEIKTAEVRRLRADLGSLTKPNLPRPNCHVKLICGPPAAGKSTFVRANAASDDIIIDLDMIARQCGMGRYRPGATRALLLLRNQCLAALAEEPPNRVAWVIISAPSKELRQWWCSALAVLPDDMVILTPPRTELRRRVIADADRRDVIDLHLSLIDRWFARDVAVAELAYQINDLDV
jgi:5-methylcytosine-specific restriction enzyme A